MKELLQKLEDSKYFGPVSGHRESVNEGIDDCTTLVREAFDGKTLVPDDLVTELLELVADDDYYFSTDFHESCELLKAQGVNDNEY